MKLNPPVLVPVVIVCFFVITVAMLSFSGSAKAHPGEVIPDMGHEVVLALDAPHAAYNSVPPTSGPHMPRIAPWGVAEVQVPDVLQVQNLEDGGIVMHYDPVRVGSSTVDILKKIVVASKEQVLLEPYTKPPLPSPIVLTAWTRLLKLDTADEKTIKQFIEAYRGINHHVSPY